MMSNLKNAILLVVDDDKKYQEIHKRRLENKVHKIYIVDNRLDAMKLIQGQFFHAAVLDIRLVDEQNENVEGLELAEVLFKRGESTGLVLVSSYGTVERVRDSFRKFQSVDFLEKATYTPDKLFAALEDAIINSTAYVEQERQKVLPSLLVKSDILDIFKKNFNYMQGQSFDQVFQYLMRPLAPLIVSQRSECLEDENLLKISCWSRFRGCAYVIQLGTRKQISEKLELYRQSGLREDDLYTMGNVSGIRFIDNKLSPDDFV